MLIDLHMIGTSRHADRVRWAERLLGRHQLLVILSVGVGIAFLLVAAIVFTPQWLVDTHGLTAPDAAKARSDFRSTVVAILGGLAVAAGAVVAAFNFRETSRQNRAALELQRRGQLTERFTKAIEQLGADRLEVRVGAVYALEQIAGDSAELHWPVMEILAAYLREHTPWDQSVTQSHSEEDRRGQPAQPVPVDVQAIVTVIGRRPYLLDPHDRSLDLHGVDFKMANMAFANLASADLRGCRLDRCRLEAADLHAALLDGAHLVQASLPGAYLSGARAQRAILIGANLSGAMLANADLAAADLRGALLNGADATGANLSGADCRDTAMVSAILTSARFDGANLSAAALNFVNIANASFANAILHGTDFTDSDVNAAHGLTDAQLDDAIVTKTRGGVEAEQ